MLTRLRGQRVKLQTIATAMTGMFVYGLSAITGPLLAGALGPAGRGDLSAVQVPAQLFGFVLCFGLPEAAVYYSSHHERRSSIGTSWAFAVGAGAPVVTALWFLIPLYLHGHAPITVLWLRTMLIVMIAFVPVTVAINLTRSRSSMRAFNVLTAFPYVLNTALIVGLRLTGHLELRTALFSFYLSQVTWYVVVLLFCQAWPSRHYRWSIARSEIHYGARVAVGSLSELVVGRLDQFLLVGVVTSAQLGLYAVAVTAAGVSGPAAWGVAIILFPRLRATRASGEGWKLSLQAMRWTMYSSTFFALLVAISAPFVLPLLFGHAFHGSLHPLWLLLPGQIAIDLANVLSQRAMAENRPGAVSRGYGLAAIITVVGLIIFLGPFGIAGAAIVTTFSQFCYLAYLFFSLRPGRKGRRKHRVEVPDDPTPYIPQLERTPDA